MAKKVLVMASQPGGVNAIKPAAQMLKDRGYNILIHANTCLALPGETVTIGGVTYPDRKESHIDICKREIDSCKPDAILLGTASQKTAGREYFEQAYTLLAREKGIPTVAVVDLPISEVERFSDIYDETHGRLKFLPDKICADSIAYGRMIEQGFPKDRIVVTGNPHFDDIGGLVRNSEEHRKLSRNLMGVRDHDFVLLYVSDVRSDLENLKWGFTDGDCIDAVCKGITDLPLRWRKDVVLVIKKHPREVQNNFDELCKKAAAYNVDVRTSAYNIRHDILGSDLVVGIVSTALLEATMMDKDAMSLQPNPEREKTDDYFLNTQDIIPHSYTRDGCKNLVSEALLRSALFLPYVEKRAGLKGDGKATERVVEVIKGLIK